VLSPLRVQEARCGLACRLVSVCVRIETSVFRKMPGYMHAPFSSALPSVVKLGTVISQRIRYITICSTEEAFTTMWDPYYTYFLNIGYSSGMMGKIVQRFPYSLRASLLAKMDVKAARRGFTSWDEDCDAERVVPLVLFPSLSLALSLAISLSRSPSRTRVLSPSHTHTLTHTHARAYTNSHEHTRKHTHVHADTHTLTHSLPHPDSSLSTQFTGHVQWIP
jgi:hypothetical protein